MAYLKVVVGEVEFANDAEVERRARESVEGEPTEIHDLQPVPNIRPSHSRTLRPHRLLAPRTLLMVALPLLRLGGRRRCLLLFVHHLQRVPSKDVRCLRRWMKNKIYKEGAVYGKRGREGGEDTCQCGRE